jgi:hypothetical protein
VNGASFTWKGGSIGKDGTIGGLRICGQDGLPLQLESGATGAVIDGLRFNPQDGDPTPNSCSANGVHLEEIRVQETQNVTIKNNYFVDDSGVPGNGDGSGHIFVTSASPSSTAAAGLVLQNNVFERTSGTYAIQVHSNVTNCGWTFAYNTFAQPVALQCNDTNMKWIGNLGADEGCVGTHVKNVVQSSTPKTCGSDKWVSGPDGQLGNLGIGPGGHLLAGSPAIDAGETDTSSDYCTGALGGRDFENNMRPAGAACDAGASEFK